MRRIMRRDRSSRYVMSARDAVDHRSRRRKLRKRLFSSRANSVLSSSAVVVRRNVKHDALSSHSSKDRNPRHRLSVRRGR